MDQYSLKQPIKKLFQSTKKSFQSTSRYSLRRSLNLNKCSCSVKIAHQPHGMSHGSRRVAEWSVRSSLAAHVSCPLRFMKARSSKGTGMLKRCMSVECVCNWRRTVSGAVLNCGVAVSFFRAGGAMDFQSGMQ